MSLRYERAEETSRPVGGFADVDHAGPPAIYVEYLDRVRSSTHRQAWKAETIELLGLVPGDVCLDLGCGTGEDVATMAASVGASGLAVGVDRSMAPANVAADRHHQPGTCFVVADAAQLPFASGCASAIRVERTLQTVAEPSVVVDEAVRLLRPGGRLAALEPDWETLVYSSPLEETSRAITTYRIKRKPARTVGRHLGRLMAGAGLSVESVSPRALAMTSFEQACYAFNVKAVVEAAIADGAISRSDGRSWLESLRSADAGGGFVASVTSLLAVGQKPDALV